MTKNKLDELEAELEKAMIEFSKNNSIDTLTEEQRFDIIREHMSKTFSQRTDLLRKPFDDFFNIAHKYEPIERAKKWLLLATEEHDNYYHSEAFVYFWSRNQQKHKIKTIADCWYESLNYIKTTNRNTNNLADNELAFWHSNIRDASVIRTIEWGEIDHFEEWSTLFKERWQEIVFSSEYDSIEISGMLFDYCRSGRAIEWLGESLVSGLDKALFNHYPDLKPWEHAKMNPSTKEQHFGYFINNYQIASTLFAIERLSPLLTNKEKNTYTSELTNIIITHQTDEGGWFDWSYHYPKQCVITTSIAIHALHYAPGNYANEIELAVNWLQTQNPYGYWSDLYNRQSEYTTTLALDAIELARKSNVNTITTYRTSTIKTQQLLNEYHIITDALFRLGNQMERFPSTYQNKGEEAIRDLFLLLLGVAYQPSSTGESFNSKGKTDILVQRGNDTILVGECKIWAGESAFKKCITQLYSYLTRQDKHAALLIFVNTINFSRTCKTAVQALKSTSDFLRLTEERSNNYINCIVRHPKDKDTTLNLTLILFHTKS